MRRAGEGNSNGNGIVRNSMPVRILAVSTLSSDATLVDGNDLTWTTGGGQGVQILRDSHPFGEPVDQSLGRTCR